MALRPPRRGGAVPATRNRSARGITMRPAVSVSAVGVFLDKVLTRKTTKIRTFCLKSHAFSEVFEERLEFPEQEKNIRNFVRAQKLTKGHKN